jgi:hypothetical protein
MPRGPKGDGQTRRVSSTTHRAPGRFIAGWCLLGGKLRKGGREQMEGFVNWCHPIGITDTMAVPTDDVGRGGMAMQFTRVVSPVE